MPVFDPLRLSTTGAEEFRKDDLGFVDVERFAFWEFGKECDLRQSEKVVGLSAACGIEKKWQREILAHHFRGEIHRDAGVAVRCGNDALLPDEILRSAIDEDFQTRIRHGDHQRISLGCPAEFRVEGLQCSRSGGGIFDLQHAAAGDDAIERRVAAMESDIALEAEFRADYRSREKRDDSVVRDDEAEMLPLPWPAGERDGEKVYAQNAEPDGKPRGFVNVGLRDFELNELSQNVAIAMAIAMVRSRSANLTEPRKWMIRHVRERRWRSAMRARRESLGGAVAVGMLKGAAGDWCASRSRSGTSCFLTARDEIRREVSAGRAS